MATTVSSFGAVTATSETLSSARCILAGIPVDGVNMQRASAQAVDWLTHSRSSAPRLIMGPNAQLVGLAQKNAEFSNALRSADLNVPDGISVVLASQIVGQPIKERVTGGDLMEQLCRDAVRHDFSVFLLGGLTGAADRAAENLTARYPGLKIAGTYCPPLGFEHDAAQNEEIFKRLEAARPDLLCVALGAPKQEIWMHRHRHRLPVGAALSVGAALDTQGNLRRRAPRWTHRLGVEWLYRLIAEPKRLWRRYLLGNSYFIYLVIRQMISAEHADRTQP